MVFLLTKGGSVSFFSGRRCKTKDCDWFNDDQIAHNYRTCSHATAIAPQVGQNHRTTIL
jgi:hypothetical protein